MTYYDYYCYVDWIVRLCKAKHSHPVSYLKQTIVALYVYYLELSWRKNTRHYIHLSPLIAVKYSPAYACLMPPSGHSLYPAVNKLTIYLHHHFDGCYLCCLWITNSLVYTCLHLTSIVAWFCYNIPFSTSLRLGL